MAMKITVRKFIAIAIPIAIAIWITIEGGLIGLWSFVKAIVITAAISLFIIWFVTGE